MSFSVIHLINQLLGGDSVAVTEQNPPPVRRKAHLLELHILKPQAILNSMKSNPPLIVRLEQLLALPVYEAMENFQVQHQILMRLSPAMLRRKAHLLELHIPKPQATLNSTKSNPPLIVRLEQLLALPVYKAMEKFQVQQQILMRLSPAMSKRKAHHLELHIPKPQATWNSVKSNPPQIVRLEQLLPRKLRLRSQHIFLLKLLH
jgi:hypothetical protein